jgi:excisionase family DNA binding protein
MTDILAPGWLTTEEAQALTGYTVDHLQRLARGGQVTARKIGDSWLFDRESLTTYQAAARPGPKRRRNHTTANTKPGPKPKT